MTVSRRCRANARGEAAVKSAPSDWDTQSNGTETYVGDTWPGKSKNVSNGCAKTVEEYLTGSNTTYGQIVDNVTARSPGSASNVDVNSVTTLLIPGQQPLVSQNSNKRGMLP